MHRRAPHLPSAESGIAAVVDADASKQGALTDAQCQAFVDNGLLVVRNLIGDDELDALRTQTQPLVGRAVVRNPDDDYRDDFRYRTQTASGNAVAYRVEYVLDKSAACRALMGHPFVLSTVEKLQGRNFIPTYDALVFKLAGEAPAIPWHVDAFTDRADDAPIFNVDFYLDGSDLSNCVWGIPGSNRWPRDEVDAFLGERRDAPFDTTGAIPILMAPGDALIHNIRVLHGSAPSASWYRRVLYYEFRPMETELRVGPHHPRYLPLKQHVLRGCLEERRSTPYGRRETPFEYRPDPEYAAPAIASGGPDTYRYPHEDFAAATS